MREKEREKERRQEKESFGISQTGYLLSIIVKIIQYTWVTHYTEKRLYTGYPLSIVKSIHGLPIMNKRFVFCV